MTTWVNNLFPFMNSNVAPPVAVPNRHIRAVLTDFDGVVGDNEDCMTKAYATLCLTHPNQNLPEAQTALCYSQNPRAFMKAVELSDEAKQVFWQHGRYFYEHTPMQFLPNAEDALAGYEKSGTPWAVVSNNHITKQHWQEMGLNQRFPNVPVFDNAHKPSTRCLQEALTALNQPAGKDVIMVDDGWKGLVAAAELGLTPVYIGDKAHIVVPIVKQECANRGLPEPEVVMVKNNAELANLVAQGIPPRVATTSLMTPSGPN